MTGIGPVNLTGAEPLNNYYDLTAAIGPMRFRPLIGPLGYQAPSGSACPTASGWQGYSAIPDPMTVPTYNISGYQIFQGLPGPQGPQGPPGPQGPSG